MTVEQLINRMEYDVQVKVWDNNEDDDPLYEGNCGGVPPELCEREVTNIYAGNYVIGIDTD